MPTQPSNSVQSAVAEALCQGECLLEALSDQAYRQRLPEAFDASIGGHYRHCLEHFEALLPGEQQTDAEIDYDARKRDRRLETDRLLALERTRELARQLQRRLDAQSLSQPVRVRCKVSYVADDSPLAHSSLEREAMYSVAHAIHHYALVSVMCRLMQAPLPEGFGIAPSTAQHRARLAKAAHGPEQ